MRRLITSARNLRKDADTRARVRRWLYLIAYLALLTGLELSILRRSFVETGVWTIPFYGLIFGGGFLAFQAIRRSHRSQDELLSYSFSVPAGRRSDAAAPALHEYLVARAGIIGSLIVRGGSEHYLRNHKLGENMEAVTRKNQNNLLRDRGLWPSLEPEELRLVSVADGGWSPEEINQVPEWCEQLRILRWVLKVDGSLFPLSHYPLPDFSTAATLGNFDLSRISGGVLQPSDIRPARDLAYGYSLSTALEMKGRGLVSATESLAEQEREMRVSFLQKSGEFVVDGRYVSELKDDELRYLFLVAEARWSFCQYLIGQLAAESITPYSQWASTRGAA